MSLACLAPLESRPDQAFLLQPLSEDAVFGQGVTQQEVILLLLWGHKQHPTGASAGSSCWVLMRSPSEVTRGSADAPTGPVEFVLMTLQNSVTGCSRKRPCQ